MSLLHPDDFLSSVVCIDEAELAASGIRNILIDLDNTVLPRGTATVPDDILDWIQRMKREGLSFCLLSNNWHERCHACARQMDIPLVCRALKPLPFAFYRALSQSGFVKSETVVVGDQVFTDVLGAHLAGMKVIMVKPLAKQDLPHTLFLRIIERLLLGELIPRR